MNDPLGAEEPHAIEASSGRWFIIDVTLHQETIRGWGEDSMAKGVLGRVTMGRGVEAQDQEKEQNCEDKEKQKNSEEQGNGWPFILPKD